MRRKSQVNVWYVRALSVHCLQYIDPCWTGFTELDHMLKFSIAFNCGGGEYGIVILKCLDLSKSHIFLLLYISNLF